MKLFPLRLKPDEDLRQSLQNFTQEKNITAGFIMTVAGSLKQASIRFANQDKAIVLNNYFEILNLNGTIATNGSHLHITISNRYGHVMGGHLVDGCIIYTTAEIIIGSSDEFTFIRNIDQKTGYPELEIISSAEN